MLSRVPILVLPVIRRTHSTPDPHVDRLILFDLGGSKFRADQKVLAQKVGCQRRVRFLMVVSLLPCRRFSGMEKHVVALRTKPIEEITLEDIRELVETHVPEGDQIEFKRCLPVSKGKPDTWAANRTIGEHAKREVLEEVVAFANAYGGTLVLGIEESKGKPAVAGKVAPIVDCEELAERLKLIFRDGVEPQLPALEVKAVRTASDGGVVVIRAQRSRMAPHRVKRTRRCTIRRGDWCEEMSMREIQDMTLNVSRGIQRLEEKFTAKREEFERQCEILGMAGSAFGLRITAVPVGQDLWVNSVVRNGTIDDRFAPPAVRVSRVTSDSEPTGRPIFGVETAYGMTRGNWVPRLRAVCAEKFDYSQSGRIDRRARLEVHCDGVMDAAFLSRIEIQGPGDITTPMPFVDTVPIVEFAQVCMWADQVRNVSGAPGSEYAIEVEIRVTNGSVMVEASNNTSSMRMHRSASMQAPGILFPRFLLGSVEETGSLCEILERDFWNAMGKDIAANQGKIRVVRP